jgi:mannose-6-phosphate isomerase-like protein (cupin superfamily)
MAPPDPPVLAELLTRRVARFVDRQPDWDAFADARVEGFRRAQHRYIGAGASGKIDPRVVPAEHFTLSVMFLPPGQGNAAHRHEVEEVFFVLQGKVLVFFEDEAGQRAEAVLGRWDCVSCPANVIHGLRNAGPEPAYFQVMLGKGQPELMGYVDASLRERRDEHLRAAPPPSPG